jgi:NAD(P)-dependent dehydrogenase (short-subunit alcohol dehydrogenase family)
LALLDRFRLDGKTAIVTGASSGIGERIATVFAEVGASVYAVARRAERLSAIASGHPGVIPWPADLANEEVCENLIDEVHERAGGIDILVNNAGVANIARAQDESTTDLHRIITLNLNATFLLSQGAGRAMIDHGGGSILNIASVIALVGMGRPLPQAAYAASKGACVSLTRELAAQWARHGIRVNALGPGWVDTEMSGEWLATDRGRDTVQRQVPLNRPAHVDEIASAALFFSSEASSYLTGCVIPVDGGWTAL